MKEKPINLNAREVQGIMDGSITLLLRVIKPQPPNGYIYGGNDGGDPYLPNEDSNYWKSNYIRWRPKRKYSVGDRLWCREPFTSVTFWTPSQQMPQWASRNNLEVTSIEAKQIDGIWSWVIGVKKT